MKIIRFAAMTAFSLLLVDGATAADLPPKAPPAKSPATYLSHQELAAVMKTSIATGKDPALSQIASTDEYFINEVHRTKTAVPYAHPGWTEVHIILAGGGTLITGGRISTRPDGTKVIEDGVSRKVQKGDVVIVPADTPHWYSQIDGSLDAIEVRYITPEAATTRE
jgi:mannose-6-phosphate isomerase-like protein (cupin superfamily)